MSFYHDINIKPQKSLHGSHAPCTTLPTAPIADDSAQQHDESLEASNEITHEDTIQASVGLTRLLRRKKATQEETEYVYKEIERLMRHYDDVAVLPQNSRLSKQ